MTNIEESAVYHWTDTNDISNYFDWMQNKMVTEFLSLRFVANIHIGLQWL